MFKYIINYDKWLNVCFISDSLALAAGGLRHTQLWSITSSDQKSAAAELSSSDRLGHDSGDADFLTQLDAPAFLAGGGHSSRRGARAASSAAGMVHGMAASIQRRYRGRYRWLYF